MSVAKLATINLFSIKEKLKPENISLEKHSTAFAQVSVKSVQSALSDLKRLPERLQSQCNYRPFIT